MENENTMEQWIQAALESGFSEAASLDVSTLKPMPAVRDMCAADKCKAYGHNWTCPSGMRHPGGMRGKDPPLFQRNPPADRRKARKKH